MRRTILLLLALLPLLAHGQNLNSYTATSEQGQWNSIAQTGTQLTSVVGDYGTQTVALPFNFLFGNLDLPAGSNITVRSDGFVVVYGSASNNNPLNYWSGSSAAIISPLLLIDGQMPSGTSGCWWQVMTDDNGDQMLVIEFKRVQHYPSYPITTAEAANDDFNYQLRLHENGDVSCVYGRLVNGVSSDTLFNFMLIDATTMVDNFYNRDHIALRGTWDSVIASTWTPGLRSGNNWVFYAQNNPAGLPDSGTVVTFHRPLPPCPRPTAIAVSQISYDSALLSWVENGVQGAYYYVQYDTVDFTPGGAGHHSDLYPGDTMHLVGLSPNHQYYVYMRSDCGSDSSEWFGVTFHTPCAPMTSAMLPFIETFEGYAAWSTEIYNQCWNHSANYAYAVRNEGSGEPNKALLLHQAGLVTLPPVDSLRIRLLTLRIQATATMNVEVGVLEDPSDESSFVPVRVFPLTVQGTTSGWVSCQIPFGSYTGTGNTIAIRRVNTSSYAGGWLWIDDINLNTFVGCLPVDDVSVGEVGQRTAEVAWNDYLQRGSYRVVYHPVSALALADSVVVSVDSVTLNGLTPNTDYVVKVYALCSDSSVSEPLAASLHTRCAVPLPVVENFDNITDLPDCWLGLSHYTGYGSHTLLPAPAVVNEETHCVKMMSRYISYHSIDEAYLLLPFVDTVVNRLRLTFSYRAARFPNSMELSVGIIDGDENIEDMTVIETLNVYDTLWHTYTVETGAHSDIVGRLVIRQSTPIEHAWVSGYPYDLGYVDNINIEVLPECDRPAAVHVSYISSTTALVHWQENNSVGTYRVYCDGVEHTVTGDTTLLLTGLTPAQDYTVGVAKLCNGTYTAYRTTMFFTACAPIASLPWMEDFETWPSGEVDYCWLRYFGGGSWGSAVKAISTDFIENGNGMLEMDASNFGTDPQPHDAIAVLPEVDAPLNGLAIGFLYKSYYGSPSDIILELGVMDDAGDSTTFRHLDTLVVAGTWNYYEHVFSAADSGRIALRMKALSSQQRLFIDEVSLFPYTGCHRPDGLTVDTVTQHTATITIADSAATGHYRLYWHQTYGTAVDSMDVAATTATVSGLAGGTGYVVRAAALCDNGQHVSNVVSTTLITDCDTVLRANLPYSETFNSYHLSTCWHLLPANTNNVYVDSVHHGAVGRSLNLAWTRYSAQAYAVMPVIDTLAGVDLTFWLQGQNYFNTALVTVGILADPQDSTTFTPVQTIAPEAGWHEYQISLGDYSAAGHYVAFRMGSSDSTGYTWARLDDVMLTPSLPCQRPDSVMVDSVGPTSAWLTIADHNDNRHYRVLLTSQNGTTTVHQVDFAATDSIYQFVLTGLAPASDYQVTASSVCYEGSVTFYVSSQFTTLCAPMPLPYRQNFEAETYQAMPRCWQASDGRALVAQGTAAVGQKSLFVGFGDTLQSTDVFTAELAVDNDSIRVDFFIQARQGYSDSNWHAHYFDTPLQVFAAIGDSLVLLHEDTVPYGNTWQFISFTTPELPYGTRLLFRPQRVAGATGTVYGYLDELYVGYADNLQHCGQVSNLSLDEVGYTYATFSWTPYGNENRWEVYLRGEGTNVTTTVDTNSIIFMGLAHSTDFICLVRPLCNDVLVGPWSDTLFFATDGCLPVSGVTVTQVGPTTADVSWTAPEGQERWLVLYGEQDFVRGQGTEVTEDSTGCHLSGLEPNTTYDLYVRTLCDEGLRSVWSTKTVFTTSPAGIGRVDVAEVRISPNPTSGKTTVSGLPPKAVVTLHDAAGRIVATQQADGDSLTLDLGRLPAGVYFLKASAAGTTAVKKVVKR